ncbi:MAG: signal peptidase II [Actinobacteria bacterium]|nr:signal peptidase II [Actinomycetota bacterium]
MTTSNRPVGRQVVEDAIDRRLRRESRARWTRFAVAAGLLLVVDQVTKAIVRATLELGERRDVIPGLAIERTDNTGIAFSLLPGRQVVVTVLSLVAMVGIGVLLASLGRRNASVALGGGALVGGSIGNLVDRLTRGAVTDFLRLPNWPNFNIADVGITCGTILVVYGLWRTPTPAQPPTP